MANWWDDFVGFVESGTIPPIQNAADPILSWLKTTAGGIASGIEGGIVSLLKDLWDVIIGPVEIITGAVIFALGLTLLFKDDLTGIASFIR
jgi:hypothetical protein